MKTRLQSPVEADQNTLVPVSTDKAPMQWSVRVERTNGEATEVCASIPAKAKPLRQLWHVCGRNEEAFEHFLAKVFNASVKSAVTGILLDRHYAPKSQDTETPLPWSDESDEQAQSSQFHKAAVRVSKGSNEGAMLRMLQNAFEGVPRNGWLEALALVALEDMFHNPDRVTDYAKRVGDYFGVANPHSRDWTATSEATE